PIEVDRRVQGLEGGILGLAEARHAGGAAYAALRPSAIWDNCVAMAKPSRYRVMAHPIQAPVPAGWRRRSRARRSSTTTGTKHSRPSAISTHGDQPVMMYCASRRNSP